MCLQHNMIWHMFYYYTSLSFFLYKNMTVVLLLHPKINCMTITLVVPVKNCRIIPPCGNFSNHISRTFLNHSSHWFKLYASPRTFSLRELNYRESRRQVNNGRWKQVCCARRWWYFENYWLQGCESYQKCDSRCR